MKIRSDSNKKFDLIILINVIEHCYDVLEVFNKILKMCSHKAIFIFEDKLYDHEIVKEQVGHIYDAAHPLRVDRNIVMNYLDGNFRTLYKRIQYNKMVLEGVEQIWDDLYYIGEKIK